MSTYTKLIYHIVFATAGRRPSLDGAWVSDLYALMGGMIRQRGGKAEAIGGMPDHVHLCVRLRTTPSLADVLREVKAKTSSWVKAHGGPADFGWQPGYGAFTVSESNVGKVIRYIEDQPLHHSEVSSLDELAALLDKHGVPYERCHLK